MHEEYEEDDENVDAALEYWDEDHKEEFHRLHEELKEDVDNKLKPRLAKFLLNIIKETPHHEENIRESARLIASFLAYTFDDQLDEALLLAGQIELPSHKREENTFAMWKKLREIIEKYVGR
ncbi:hypothetical protein KW787_00865 [Candidatus Pacearchaeota archaeon]|nr:hypothetical protein [Candidatus Pacearchaeota archaeon]